MAPPEKVEHRMLTARFEHDEGHEQHAGGDEAADHPPGAEPGRPGLDEGIDETRQRGREHHEPGPVRATGALGARLDYSGEAEHAGDHADRHVDEEDPPPRKARDEHPANDRSDRHSDAGDRSPNGERHTALLATEGVGEQGERNREHDRAANALQSAGQLEHERGLRSAAERRGAREDGEADHPQTPAAEYVGERAAREQQGGERERVGVDHPLQVGEARVQRRLNRRQGDVDDRDVEQQHERAEADGGERPPLRVGAGRCVWLCSRLRQFGGDVVGGHAARIAADVYACTHVAERFVLGQLRPPLP